jgi:glycosyltransferase involved in cell wall biosynthesis
MLISIIVRYKNEEEAMDHALQKIITQEIDRPFEVVIVDSGSTDRTPEIVKQYPVRLFQMPPEWFSFGSALNCERESRSRLLLMSPPIVCLWIRAGSRNCLNRSVNGRHVQKMMFDVSCFLSY